MREFILENGQLIAVGIAGTEVFITLILLILALVRKKASIVLMFLISLGLTFDAAMIAFGGSFSDDLLMILSKVRYVAHGLLLPLSVAVCGYVLKWEYSFGLKLCWLLSILLCGAGAAASWFCETELVTVADIVCYAPVESGTPEWASLIIKVLPLCAMVPLTLSGLISVFRSKNPTILLGGLCMLGFSLLGALTDNKDLVFLFSLVGECLLLFFCMLHALTAFKDEKGLL